MAFIIRSAESKDFETIQTFLKAEFIDAGYTNADIDALQGTKYDPAQSARKIITALNDEESQTRCWLAISENHAVGMITTKDMSGGIFVDKNNRGKGIGSALVRVRNDFYQKLGKAFAEAQIESTNTASISMHQKLGYKFNEHSQQIIDSAMAKGIALPEITNENGLPVVLTMIKPL